MLNPDSSAINSQKHIVTILFDTLNTVSPNNPQNANMEPYEKVFVIIELLDLLVKEQPFKDLMKCALVRLGHPFEVVKGQVSEEEIEQL